MYVMWEMMQASRRVAISAASAAVRARSPSALLGERRSLVAAARGASVTSIEPWPDHARPIEEASTLPSSWYVDTAVADAERRHVFGSDGSWQLAAHATELPSAGAFVSGAVAPWRYVVTRGGDGVLRAFHNVCRHHAAPVAAGSGVADGGVLTCCYHGWSYALDGRLARAPRLKGIKGFRAADYGLKPIRLATLGPLVFLNFGGDGNDGGTGGNDGSSGRKDGSGSGVEDWLGPETVGRLRELGALDDVVHVARRSYTLRCNWKVYCDNYLDGGYHVPVAHNDLAGQLDLSRYGSELLGGGASLQTCAPDAEAGDRVAADRPAAYFFIYPNTMVNRYGPWLDTNVVTPLTPTTCRVEFDWFLEASVLARLVDEAGGQQQQQPAPAGAAGAPAARDAGPLDLGAALASAGPLQFTHPDAALLPFVLDSLASSHRVQLEDVALCEAVQAGLESPAYTQGGRYAPALEGPMFHFHRRLHAAVVGVGT